MATRPGVERAVLLGTQGWAYADWLGETYDANTKPERYLHGYAQEFVTVENDSTFYGTPLPERVRKWAAAVPDGFTFSCKVPREITHELRMVSAGLPIATFDEAMRHFSDRLGCVLFQFEASFSRAEEDWFWRSLDSVPAGIATAVEFRDPAWYEPEIQRELNGRGIALVFADAPFVPRERFEPLMQSSGVDFAYVRWIGVHDAFTRFSHVQRSRDEEIAWWSKALRGLPSNVSRIFGYVNNHYQGNAPSTVRSLYAALDLPHRRPHRIEAPQLFDA